MRLNPLALLASQGVPLAFGSDSPVTSMNPWETVRAAALHQTPASAVSMRAAFAAATRGAWRAGGVRDGVTGTLVPGAPRVLRGVGGRRTGGQPRPTTPCSAGRPTRGHGCPRCPGSAPTTRCRDAVRPFTEVSSSMAKRTPHREWNAPTTTPTPSRSSPRRRSTTTARTSTPTTERRPTTRPRRRSRRRDPDEAGSARVGHTVRRGRGGPAAAHQRRGRRRAAAVPELPAVRLVVPAIVAFALLAWVLTRDTTKLVGGFGYGFLFGAGVLRPAAAVDRRDGRVSCHGWRSRFSRRCFPRCSVCCAVAVRRLTGLADLVRRPVGALRVAQVDGAVRRIPLGRGRFRPNRRAAAAAGADRRGAAGVVRGDAARLRSRRAGLRDCRLVATRRATAGPTRRRPRWCCPASASAWC